MGKFPNVELTGAVRLPAARLLRLPLAGQVDILTDRYAPGRPAAGQVKKKAGAGQGDQDS